MMCARAASGPLKPISTRRDRGHLPPAHRREPRLHDLRHSFAVHRLIQWYQQGADVRLVYHLSVYLGHVHLRHTQVYLSMTPDLLQQAGARFEQYVRGEENHA